MRSAFVKNFGSLLLAAAPVSFFGKRLPADVRQVMCNEKQKYSWIAIAPMTGKSSNHRKKSCDL